MHNFKSAVTLVLGCLMASTSYAMDDWPTKPVRLVAAAAPGGTTDLLARLLAQRLSDKFGKTFVVENKGGAGGGVAAKFVQQADPDGYTFLVTNDQLSMQSSFGMKLEYDAIKGFKPVATIARGPVVLGVGKDVPVNDLAGLIALAKAKDSRLAFGSCGSGTILHLAGELLNISAGTNITHIPYRGCAPAMVDVLAGQVPMFVTVLGNAAPYVKEGKVKMLAVASTQRLAKFPNVPTTKEAGLPELLAEPWFGVLAPAKTPDSIIAKLTDAVKDFVAEPATVAKFDTLYLTPQAVGPDGLSKIIRSEIEQWSGVVRAAKIEIQ